MVMVRRVFILAALLAPLVFSQDSRADEPGRSLAGYRHPRGWDVRIAASEPLVVNPVTMTFGPDGRLYVVEWKAGRGPNDHIKVLTDTDGDGRFDRAEMFMENLELPAGVLFYDGWVYVTLDHDVVRVRDRDGDGKFEARETIATGFGNDDSHHRVSGMMLGPDGWLYLTTGDSDTHARGSDGTEATVLRSGGVYRCQPDGSGMENVAFGMRNPWGNIAFDDSFHMFHTDNDNEGTPGFTGCRLLHVVEAGDYGWRLREGARCCAPDFDRATWNGGRPGRLGWMAETGRGAPAGLCVLNSAAFPDRFRNLLVYPDVFRKSVRAYRLKATGATYQAVDEFELLASDEGLFRPTDAEVGPDGALYILDWRTDSGGAGQLSGNGQTGRIYRMTWSGTNEEPARPPLRRERITGIASVGIEQLVEALANPDHGLRRAASQELIRRGREKTPLTTVLGLLRDEKTPSVAKLHALGVLFAVDATYTPYRAALSKSLQDPDRDVRRFAFELLGRREVKGDDRDLLDAVSIVKSVQTPREDPQVLRASAMTLGRFGVVKVGDARDNGPRYASGFAGLLLSEAADEIDADALLRDGITRGLERLGRDALPLLVQAVGGQDAKLAQAALFTLQGWRSDDALSAILATATEVNPRLPEDARVELFRTLREMLADVPADPIAQWLSQKRGAGARSRVQAVQLLAAMHERAVLAVGPILPALLHDPEADVRKAVLLLARDVRTAQAKDALLATVRSEERSTEERGLALLALRGYDGVDLVPLVREIFPKTNDPSLRLELLRTLASRDFPAAAVLAEALLDSKNGDLRHEAIAMLGSKPETALIVARRFLDGKLPAEDLSRVIDAVRIHNSVDLRATLQALLTRTLVSPAEVQRLRQFVARWGNTERGRMLYLDPKKGNCATCHRLEGVGGNVGPDLTRVWETLSFDKRVESILEPSKEIKEGFGSFKVATVNGRVLTGLLLSDTPEAVTLKDAEGHEVRILAKEIEEKGPEKISLMPTGVVGHLSYNELADLLAFLGDRKAQESLRNVNPAK